MTNKNIPEKVACPMASCLHCDTCVRYANYLKYQTTQDTLEIINPKLLSPSQEGNGKKACPYHLVVKKQLWAKGFQRMFATIPSGNTWHFWHRTPYYSESSYCRAKRGAILIEPEMQQRLLALFKKNGADTSIGFDEYVEQDTYVKPYNQNHTHGITSKSGCKYNKSN